MKQTYYEILNINAEATAEEIKRAYRKIAHAHHPDKNLTNPESVQLFIDASQAYEILCCEASRKKYDEHLQEQQTIKINRRSRAYKNHRWETGNSSAIHFAKEVFTRFYINDILFTGINNEDIRHYDDLL